MPAQQLQQRRAERFAHLQFLVVEKTLIVVPVEVELHRARLFVQVHAGQPFDHAIALVDRLAVGPMADVLGQQVADLPGGLLQRLEQGVITMVVLDVRLAAAQHQAGVRVAGAGRQQLRPRAVHAQYGKMLAGRPLAQAVQQRSGKARRAQRAGQVAESADLRGQGRCLWGAETNHGGTRIFIVIGSGEQRPINS
ncbi:hypothetical protein D3C80_1172580 [compost metagenome]